MNAATYRLQRQLAFPPMARRVTAAATRFVDAAGGGPEAAPEARRRMARWLRRVVHRQVERIRFMGGPGTMTWWAADCMAAELPAVDWSWLAWHWVGHVVDAGPAPDATVADDWQSVAAYVANAATLVARAVRTPTPSVVMERRLAVLDLELGRWRTAEAAAKGTAAEATT